MTKGEVMKPFRAPRSREAKTAAKASPTRQSPRRKDKPDTTTQHDTDDSEGPTELRVTRWVIPETQGVDEDNTDNKVTPIQFEMMLVAMPNTGPLRHEISVLSL